MALKLPRAAEREYIATSGIVAVYVAALPAGPAYVGISRDLLHSLRALRRRWSALQITAAFWVQAKSEARLICREVNCRLAQGQHGLLVANAKTAQRKVENGRRAHGHRPDRACGGAAARSSCGRLQSSGRSRRRKRLAS